MNYIKVNIKQPIYGNYVGVRDKYINQAKRQHKDLKITTPFGTTTISPAKYMKGATRIEKVFLIPDRPMILYCQTLVPDKPEPQPETVSVPLSIFEELAKRNPDLVKKLRMTSRTG